MTAKTHLLAVFSLLLTGFHARAASSDITSGLVAHYTLAGGAQDSSGKQNHGLIYGAGFTSDRAGNANSAAFFNSKGGKIVVPHTSDFAFGANSFSLSCWVRARSWKNYQALMSKFFETPGWDARWTFFLDDQGRVGLHWSNSSAQDHEAYTVAGIPLGEWRHVVAVMRREGTAECEIYVNGAKQSVTGRTAPIVGSFDNLMPITLGQDNHYSASLDGDLDDIRIYNRALASADISALATLAPETGSPIASAEGDLDFGTVLVGGHATRSISLTNCSSLPVTITGLICSTSVFSANWSGILPPGSTTTVPVNFHPLSQVAYEGVLEVKLSPSSSATNCYVNLAGTGVAASDVKPHISLKNGSATLNASKNPGSLLILQHSPDLQTWNSRAFATVPNHGQLAMTDTVNPLHQQGFYRYIDADSLPLSSNPALLWNTLPERAIYPDRYVPPSFSASSFKWTLPLPGDFNRGDIAAIPVFQGENFSWSIDYNWTGGGSLEFFVGDADDVTPTNWDHKEAYRVLISSADIPYAQITGFDSSGQPTFDTGALESSSLYKNAWVTATITKSGDTWSFYRNNNLVHSISFNELTGKRKAFIIAPSNNYYKQGMINVFVRKAVLSTQSGT